MPVGGPQREPAPAGASEGRGLRRNLTRRQGDVLQLIARGLSHDEIARLLGVRVSTVQNQLDKILDKLQAQSAGEALAAAIRDGIVRSPPEPEE